MNQDGRPWSLLLSAYHFLMIAFTGISTVLELFFGSGILQDLIQAMSMLTVYTHIHGKVINVLLHQTEIRKLLNRLDKLRYEIMKYQESSNLITQMDMFLKKMISAYGAMLISFPFISVCSSFLVDYLTNFEKPHLVLQVWIPWSMNGFWSYIAGMLLPMFMSLTSVIYYLSFSIVQFTFTFQISVFLRILQIRLENYGPKDRSIYIHHISIIQLIQDYNNLFAGQMYLEILMSSLQPCGFVYGVVKAMKKNDPGALVYFHTFIMAISAPFIVCACGQEISTQLDKLHGISYMGKWYEETPKIRRDLLTMMSVTVKPTTLRYRTLFTFDYVCFATVVQGIYTYLTMISHFETD